MTLTDQSLTGRVGKSQLFLNKSLLLVISLLMSAFCCWRHEKYRFHSTSSCNAPSASEKESISDMSGVIRDPSATCESLTRNKPETCTFWVFGILLHLICNRRYQFGGEKGNLNRPTGYIPELSLLWITR